MRIVVYALVLANLGFWAWTAWFVPQAPEASRFEGPGLTLLRELEPVELPPPLPPVAPVAAPAPALRCVGVGPFIEGTDAESARTTLAEAGIDARAVPEQAEIWDGFWVYVGQIADLTAARAMVARIEEAGIEDAYIIQNSDSGILISLGVYSELSRAGALADRIGNLDLAATVTERTRIAEVVWLEFVQDAADTTALELLRQQFVEEPEQRACIAEL